MTSPRAGTSSAAPVVVVGVDDQPGSALAVAWAAAEAQARGAPLRLVHAWSWGVLSPRSAASEHAVHADVSRRADALFDLYVPLAATYCTGAVTTDVVEGYAADVLTSEARTASLVVVGSHHLHSVGRAVLGSSSSSLASRAPCPVVVVCGPAAPLGPHAGVVVGLSGTTDDARLLDFGYAFAQRRRMPLRAILCWDPPLHSRKQPPPRQIEQWATDFIAPWREAHPDVHTDVTALHSPPIETLALAAADQALLVVGRRHERLYFGSVLGSTCLGVLHHATCAVAVIPPSPSDAASAAGESTPGNPAAVATVPLKEIIMSDTITLELTSAEVHLVENALRSFRNDFGHDEAEVVESIQALLAKLPQLDQGAASAR